MPVGSKYTIVPPKKLFSSKTVWSDGFAKKVLQYETQPIYSKIMHNFSVEERKHKKFGLI
jgi:hypothetical protein